MVSRFSPSFIQNADMRKRLQIALAVLLVGVIGGIGWQSLRHREPVYQGKSLSTWLEGYTPDPKSYRPLVEQPQWQQANAAVRGLGTNAIPSLLRMLRARDNPWKLKLVRLASNQRFIKISYVSASELNVRAAMAFGSLPDHGSNSVPELIQIYKENRSEESQSAVVLAFRSIGPAASQAVPVLLNAAGSSDLTIRHNALAALGEIHAQPDLVVPLLTKALRDQEPHIRSAAAMALRDFGAEAKPAVPALLELLKDGDSYVSTIAAESLEQIDPEAAANAGVKKRPFE